MALSSTQLEAFRDALQTAMFKGIRSITFQDRRIDYASVDEMRKALQSLNDQINTANSTTTVRRSYISFNK